MKILAIESSCDETSASVINDGKIISNIISSQHFHGIYGGVIPELASRAHLDFIMKVVLDSLAISGTLIGDVDAIAVTTEPGLIGSLLVGSNFGKGLSIKYKKPIIPINHIEGHLFSGCLQDSTIEFPFIALVVSGGHTLLFYVESYSKYYILGSTIDDAAGEAFDKIATLLGLSYPGGPEIDRIASGANTKAYKFPRSMINSGDYNFSFSGLKTSVRYFIHKEFPVGIPENLLPDLSASIQQAIVDVLVKKSIDAAIEKKVNQLVIAGGVSANSVLRKDMTVKAALCGMKVITPDAEYCMDNAAMIGFLAERKLIENGDGAYNNLTFKVNATSLKSKRENKKNK